MYPSEYTYDVSAFEEDVRILCHEPRALANRLHSARIITALELPEGYAQKDLYPPEALVPDPGSVQRCTNQQVEQFVHPFEPHSRRSTDVVLYLGAHAHAFWDAHLSEVASWERLGSNTAPPGQLTTTPNEKLPPDSPPREGLHVDTPGLHGHRLGACVQGVRWLLVGTVSPGQLLGQDKVTTGTMRSWMSDNPRVRDTVHCLMVPFGVDDFYDAYTEDVLHDGSTLLNEKSASHTDASIVFFQY